MTKQDPGDRPTAAEAIKMLAGIVARRRPYQLRWRSHPVDDGFVTRIYKDLHSMVREVKHLRGLSAGHMLLTSELTY